MSIDIFIKFLASAMFLIGLLGIGLIVLNASRNRPIRGGVIMALVGLILGAILFVVGEGLVFVGPTERVVVFNTVTGDLQDPLEPGLHIIFPGVNQTYDYVVSRQEYTMSGTAGEGSDSRSDRDDAIEARSIDGQEVLLDITVIFTIDPENVNAVHQNWSDLDQGYIEGLIRPTVRSLTRRVVATARAEEIFGSEVLGEESDAMSEADIPIDPETGFAYPNAAPNSRSEVEAEIERLAAVELAQEGFTVVEILLNEINFSQDFIQAIENRQVAVLERDRASVQAETARIEASGQADARIELARGEAEAVRIQAAADAEALRLVSQQLAANPNLIQYTYINELGEDVSVIMVPTNSPFLFDAATFTQLGDDFQAPEVPALETPDTDSN